MSTDKLNQRTNSPLLIAPTLWLGSVGCLKDQKKKSTLADKNLNSHDLGG